MGFLNLALGAVAGMAQIAGERNQRAFQLNQRGVSMANRGNLSGALNCFYEAERMMPPNEELRRTIQANIRQCERELRY